MEKILFLSFAISFFTTLLVIPYWIKRAKKANLLGIDMNKHKKTEVAEMGGIIVILGFIFGVLYYIALRTFYFSFDKTTLPILAAITTVLIITLVGVIDDLLGWKIGLRQYQKPILTLIAALPIMVINVGHTEMLLPIIGLVDFGLVYPLIIIPIGIVGASNGFNMLAGYNGLESGMGVIILSTLGFVAWQNNLGWVSIIAFCMVFSLLAFLIYNKYPSKIFPGDSLTYSAGALIAIIAILGNMEKIALILFIPYFIEFILKARGKMQKESFAKPDEDDSLTLRYNKVYGLEHVMVLIWNKIRGKCFERDVVYSLYLIEIILAAVVLFI